ncbi:hypothetical protein SO694_0000819 [Aureococcus anophagefferens]|uniref:Uncharacterized protein n=1 Tax=Aureococcus anophagefferens TaxID=44056 RepID=A0ABR1GDW6_AURAN
MPPAPAFDRGAPVDRRGDEYSAAADSGWSGAAASARAILAPDAAPSDAISEISFNNTDAASVRTAQPPTLEQAALATYASSRVAVPARRRRQRGRSRATGAPSPNARRRKPRRSVVDNFAKFSQAIATMGSVDEDWAAGAASGPGRRRPRDSASERPTAGAASLFSSLYSAATAPSTSSFIAACSTKVVGVVTANLFGPTMLQAARSSAPRRRRPRRPRTSAAATRRPSSRPSSPAGNPAASRSRTTVLL